MGKNKQQKFTAHAAGIRISGWDILLIPGPETKMTGEEVAEIIWQALEKHLIKDKEGAK